MKLRESEILEGNITIAKNIGFLIKDNIARIEDYSKFPKHFFEKVNYTTKELRFHRDYNWLFYCINYISKLNKDFSFEIKITNTRTNVGLYEKFFKHKFYESNYNPEQINIWILLVKYFNEKSV